MEKYLDIICKAPIFQRMSADEVRAMLACLNARVREHQKNEIILMQGAPPRTLGVVLDGQVQVVKEDSAGERMLLTTLMPPDIYGEAVCCAGLETCPVSVVAGTRSTVLTLDFSRILHLCSNTCPHHTRLIENMMLLLAQKNLFLQARMDVLRNKSIRAKLVVYFENFSPKQGQCIDLPLSRGGMADYLCVDRSALSHELMKMRREGLLDYHKNTFKLLKWPIET